MKRLATLVLPAALLLCLTGCSGNNASSSNSSSSSSEQSYESSEDYSQESYNDDDYSSDSSQESYNDDDYSSGSSQESYDDDDYSSDSSSYSSEQSDESSEDSSQYSYIEIDNRKRKSILSDAGDYQVDDSEARFTSAHLNDIVYYGLGNSYGDILNYSGRTSDSGYVGYGNHGMNGTYYTHFNNMDQNRYLMFRTSSDTYFNDNDYCYGASGWLQRVFDYEKTQGPCRARAFADILGAESTYTISSWPEEYYVPSNLGTSSLFVIEADLETALGERSCIILLEASSDSSYISGDSWVGVIIQ